MQHISIICISQMAASARHSPFEYKKRLNETKEELLELGIIEMRERYKSLSKEIIIPFELDMEMNGVVFTIPQRGDKKAFAGAIYPKCKAVWRRPTETSREAKPRTTDHAY